MLQAAVAEYADALGKYGPDSPEAAAVRASNRYNPDFVDYADALDRIKRHLGGSGIDRPV